MMSALFAKDVFICFESITLSLDLKYSFLKHFLLLVVQTSYVRCYLHAAIKLCKVMNGVHLDQVLLSQASVLR